MLRKRLPLKIGRLSKVRVAYTSRERIFLLIFAANQQEQHIQFADKPFGCCVVFAFVFPQCKFTLTCLWVCVPGPKVERGKEDANVLKNSLPRHSVLNKCNCRHLWDFPSFFLQNCPEQIYEFICLNFFYINLGTRNL